MGKASSSFEGGHGITARVGSGRGNDGRIVAQSHGYHPDPQATQNHRIRILSDIVLVLIKLTSTNQCSMLTNTIDPNPLPQRLSRCTTQSGPFRTRAI